MKRKKSHISNTAFILAAFAIIMFVISFGFIDTNIKKSEEPVKEYNGWKVNGVEIDLKAAPIQYSTDKATIYTNTITADLIGKAIEFESSHQVIHVYFDGEKIYSVENSTFFNHTAGTAYNIVQIPADSLGKEITIEVYNSYQNYKNTEKITFVYGTVTAIYRNYFAMEWFDDIIDLLLLVSGFVVLLGSIIVVRYVKTTIDIIYLSLFELFIATWSLSMSRVFNILIGNPSAMNTFGYYSLFLAPLFCLLYVRNTTYGKNVSKRAVTIVLTIHCVYILVASILQVANIIDFNRILWCYHIILAVEVILFGVFALKGIFIDMQSGKKKVKLDIFLVLLLVGVGFDLISWNFTYTYSTFSTRVCLLIYTTSIIIKFAKSVFDEIKDNMSKDELKQIAYTDQLTGIPNRNAFISKINNIDIEKVMLVSFDLNNLKYYNDRFGHDKGDHLLVTMAETLKRVFGNNAYRIGGDEFEVVLEDGDRDILWALLEKFEGEEEKFNKEKHSIYLQSAYGVGYYQGEASINAILKMADQNMYMHKKFLKSKGIGVLK